MSIELDPVSWRDGETRRVGVLVDFDNGDMAILSCQGEILHTWYADDEDAKIPDDLTIMYPDDFSTPALNMLANFMRDNGYRVVIGLGLDTNPTRIVEEGGHE